MKLINKTLKLLPRVLALLGFLGVALVQVPEATSQSTGALFGVDISSGTPRLVRVDFNPVTKAVTVTPVTPPPGSDSLAGFRAAQGVSTSDDVGLRLFFVMEDAAFIRRLVVINAHTGLVAVSTNSLPNPLASLEFDPVAGTLFGVEIFSGTPRLVRVDFDPGTKVVTVTPETPAAGSDSIASFRAAQGISTFDDVGRQLFSVMEDATFIRRLVVINTQTKLVAVSTNSLPNPLASLEFDPVAGTLFGVEIFSGTPRLVRVDFDPVTKAVSVNPETLAANSDSIADFRAAQGISTFGQYFSVMEDAAFIRRLVVINTQTKLVKVSDNSLLNPLASLEFVVGACVGKADGTACDDDNNVCTTDVCSGGTCTHPAGNAGTECRASAGVCDVPESCTGSSAACPVDGFQASGTECRASAGVCDVAESCTGASATCPVDGFQASGTECRASAGVCDVAESCTGASAACPVDGFQASGTECRASAGVCDVPESCTGSSAACPVDGFQASGTECRASAGVCDVAESCTGASATCPVDGFQAPGTECRASAGVCDVAESCTGASAACPADAKSTAVCRASAGTCDVAESCDGVSNDCPADGFASSGTVCTDDGDPCTTDTCDVNGICTHTLTATACETVGAGGGTVTTGTDATFTDPVTTSVTIPSGGTGGTVSITETTPTQTPPPGFTFLGQQINITAPSSTFDNPLVIVFRLDASLTAGVNPADIQVFKNGVPVPDCPGATVASPDDPCVSNRVLLTDGDVEITVLASTASDWNFGVSSIEICRSSGFWGTHAGTEKSGSVDITLAVITSTESGSISVCGETLTDTDLNHAHSAEEALCISTQGNQKLQLARQLTAAQLNCVVNGAAPDCLTLISGCDSVCVNPGASVNDITACIEDLDAFNNGLSDLAPDCDLEPLPGFEPPGPAGSSKKCNDAIKTPCAIIPPGEASCTSGSNVPD